MKKTIFFLLFVLASAKLFSQVGGLSASKLFTLCTQPVPVSTIEFEPNFGFSYANWQWDRHGNAKPIFQTADSTNIASGLAFRMTYGVVKNLEIGVSFPADFSETLWGAKYRFLNAEKISFAALAGANVPLGNRTYNQKHKQHNELVSFVAGAVFSFQANEKMSIDADVQYQFPSQNLQDELKNSIFVNADVGYFVKEGIQAVLGFNYFSSQYADNQLNSDLLFVNPGITIETAKNFILVMSLPVNVFGKNIEKSIGFSLALTIVID